MRLLIACSVLSFIIFLISQKVIAVPLDAEITDHATAPGSNTNQSEITSANRGGIPKLNDEIDKYQNAIEEIESVGGMYSEQIAQKLINLGNIYQHYDKHDDAVQVFKRALHLSRINEGLYSLTQIPILEKMIKSYKKRKQWTQVNDKYYYMYWLYARNFDDQDIKRLDMELQIANWHLEAYAMQLLPDPTQDLIYSYSLFDRAANLISSTYGDTDLRLITPLNGLMLTNYFIASHVTRNSVEKVYAMNEQLQVQMKKSDIVIAEMKRKSFATGKRIIERKLTVLHGQKPLNHQAIAKARLKLADWFLMHNKRQTALRHYQQAYDYAVTTDKNREFLDQLFSQPVALPHYPNLQQRTRTIKSDAELAADVSYVHATLDVTKYGKAKNIKIVSSNPPDNSPIRTKALKSLRSTKFRPQISDGVTIFTEQLQLHVFPE
ncbi:tetratricopeptide repeat protein [Thalassomonas viridans]|uniref:Tetratricopeptide repeat protein n=1 Tax=Thalassomonas viridans TaxID=137584 RepID=A0AAE9Z0Y2_9GAMM|nr:tetratricopeptide repeat protein [Thalassomonas viridans]WDE04009.1 tetratricopeptide repeat protein [Thalassomonas viridans]